MKNKNYLFIKIIYYVFLDNYTYIYITKTESEINLRFLLLKLFLHL